MTVISAAVEANGWVLAVRGAWEATPGAWEYDGFDRTNGRFMEGATDQFPLDPGGVPKLTIGLTSRGHVRAGDAAVAASRARTVVGTKALRRPFPNKVQLDETDHGDGTRTVRIALSQRIFADDVVEGVTFRPGWKAGEPGGTLAVGNGSTRAAPLPVTRWITVPYQLVAGTAVAPRTSVRVEISAASHFPEHVGSARNQALAGLSVVATDGVRTGAVSWLTQGVSPEDGLPCWGGDVDLAGLTAGIITLHHTAWPFIGEPRSTGGGHNSSAIAAMSVTWGAPLHLCFDPVGAHYVANRKFVFIDTTSPNTANSSIGSVLLHNDIDSARAAAASTKPANISVAIQKMRSAGYVQAAANGRPGGDRSLEFWEILIHDGQTVQPSASENVTTTSFTGTRDGFLVIRGDPAAANPRATCVVQSAGSPAGIVVPRLNFRQCRVLLGHGSIFANATNHMTWLDDCDVTAKPGYATNSTAVRAGSEAWVSNCNMWGYNGQPAGYILSRNNSRTVGSRSCCYLGVTVNPEVGVSNANYLFDVNAPDSMVVNFKAFRWDGAIIRADSQSSPPGIGLYDGWGSAWQLKRVVLMNVLVEGVGTRLIQLGEERYAEMQDSIWDGVTIVGEGVNFHNEPPWPILGTSGTSFEVGLEAHGLSVGNSVTIAGCLPAGYNGRFTVTSVQDSNRFRVTISPTPALMTQKGTVTLPDGSVRPLRFSNMRHTGNTLLNVALDRNATKNDNWRGDGDVIGNWELVYGVGWQGKVHANRIASSPQDWQYAYAGARSATDLSYSAEGTNWWKFVNDGTGHDGRAAAWNGDYRPGAGSPLNGRGTISNTDRTLDGQVKGALFAAGAMSSTVAVLAAVAGDAAFHPVSSAQARGRWDGRLVPLRSSHAVLAGATGLTALMPSSGVVVPGARTVLVEAEPRTLRPVMD